MSDDDNVVDFPRVTLRPLNPSEEGGVFEPLPPLEEPDPAPEYPTLTLPTLEPPTAVRLPSVAPSVPAEGAVPATFRSDGGSEAGQAATGTGMIAAAAMAVAAMRGLVNLLEDRRQRKLERHAETAPLREARMKRRLAKEEARNKHEAAMQGIADKITQERAKQRVPSGKSWGEKAAGRGSKGKGGDKGKGGNKHSQADKSAADKAKAKHAAQAAKDKIAADKAKHALADKAAARKQAEKKAAAKQQADLADRKAARKNDGGRKDGSSKAADKVAADKAKAKAAEKAARARQGEAKAKEKAKDKDAARKQAAKDADLRRAAEKAKRDSKGSGKDEKPKRPKRPRKDPGGWKGSKGPGSEPKNGKGPKGPRTPPTTGEKGFKPKGDEKVRASRKNGQKTPRAGAPSSEKGRPGREEATGSAGPKPGGPGSRMRPPPGMSDDYTVTLGREAPSSPPPQPKPAPALVSGSGSTPPAPQEGGGTVPPKSATVTAFAHQPGVDSDLTVYDLVESDETAATEILDRVEEAKGAADAAERLLSHLENLMGQIADLKIPGSLPGYAAKLAEKSETVGARAKALAAALPKASEAIAAAGQLAAETDKGHADTVKDMGYAAPAESEYHGSDA
ncbi:hypothetical protein ACFPA8_27615 [Streptomyces ovatisporus]|uniref:Uncharacterized protein n=1 Tax=Streptomyces ovatisporus TaxID=1128682 RepID=A0ABV9AGG0_9ACTN